MPALAAPGPRHKQVDGKVAFAYEDGVPVTYLQMTDPDDLVEAAVVDRDLRLEPVDPGDWRFNRRLYREVGSEWSWIDKAEWSPEQWRDYAADPAVHTFAAGLRGQLVGYVELLAEKEAIQIHYFGLLPDFIGRGYGGQLLTMVLRQAWSMQPRRVWLHTCELDHPAALANYQARGMKVIEIGD